MKIVLLRVSPVADVRARVVHEDDPRHVVVARRDWWVGVAVVSVVGESRGQSSVMMMDLLVLQYRLHCSCHHPRGTVYWNVVVSFF